MHSTTTMSALESLKQFTTVVADTGDFEAIVKFKPVDATTNPSLILAAAQLPQYASLVQSSIENARLETQNNPERLSHQALENLTVAFGAEILKIVPGRVSTEVPAALSYDTEATVKEALNIIAQYKKQGIGKERILIKIASTWQGIQAAASLEREHGIHCNLTLLFNLTQAVACAEAGATLISPFVGRILDWHKRVNGRDYTPAEDPGVLSVRSIYNYFKKFGYGTVVMGASFRNVGEIEELAGVDFLTISPALLEHLAKSDRSLQRKLSPELAQSVEMERIHMTKELFDHMMNQDPMASELLADGIKKFDQDSQKLVSWLQTKI